jgi:3-oxoacyl-[acyl-carrier-protein] synthase II
MSGRLRAVITGVGIVSPLGSSLEELWAKLDQGVSGVRRLTRFDPARFSCRLAAEVDDASCRISGGLYSHEILRAGKFVHYAVAAAESALADAGLDLAGEPRAGILLGVSTGGLDQMEHAVLRQESKGPRKVSPYQITSMLPNMAAGLIALRKQFEGPHYTLTAACASGTQALGHALHGVRSGLYDCVLAGGADGVLTPIAFSSFQAMRMLTSTEDPSLTPRPFDEGSDGIVLGEGAGMFVVEERTRALRRGARIYGELSGYGTCTGSQRVALQSAPALMRCIRLALEDAALDAGRVDCVYAQAAGIRLGDESELDALQTVFSGSPTPPAITSIKGHIGHTFAASGPLNVAAGLGSFAGRRVPPTRGLRSVNARHAAMNLWPAAGPRPIQHSLVNTYGFGGVNASLVISNPTPEGNAT